MGTDAPVHQGTRAPHQARPAPAIDVTNAAVRGRLASHLSPHHRLSPRRLIAAAVVTASVLSVAPAAAHARASNNELLAAIAQQAPNTRGVSSVTPSHRGDRLAVITSSRAPGEQLTHTNLWISDDDGTDVQPIDATDAAGSGTEYISIGAPAWSADDRALAYAYGNTAIKYARHASLVWFAADGSFEIQNLGTLTAVGGFTADDRYFTFTQALSVSGSPGMRDGAVDLATRSVLLPARTTYQEFPNRPATQAPTYAPECARAQEPDWVPAVSGSWMEQALSSPDPGCRFGANANDPGPAPTPTPTPTPDTTGASDAPSNITRPAEGTGLVPISDRTTPLGPTVRLRSSAKGLTRAMKRGLRVQLDLAGAASLKAYVLVARPSNEGLFSFANGSTTFTIGRLSIDRPPSQTQTIAIPFTRDARKVLPRFLKITVTVRLVATDSAGNRTVVERQIALTDF